MSERAARPGELCTCGRQAVTVFDTERGEVGYCGLPDGGDRSGLCPFCCEERQPWGDPAPCPQYRLRPSVAPSPR